MSKMELQMMLL